jgi:hypothetical protein
MELKTKQLIVNYAIDKLNDLKGSTNVYGCNLHHNIFKCYAASEEWLVENYGVFAAIAAIQKYEKSNFGEISTDFSNCEEVVNTLAYILGKEVLKEVKYLSKVWDNFLTHEDFNNIIKELKTLL